MRLKFVVLAIFGGASLVFAFQQQPVAVGPLAGLPSAPAPNHLATLRAIPDNTWVQLGTPAADPQWGLPGGRSWAPKMPFAPDLRGAFLYGEGVHGGYNAATGRYQDDLWFYDIHAHRWICVYPGADIYEDLTLNAEGFEINRYGETIPVAPIVHAYGLLTYDTDARRFMLYGTFASGYGVELEARRPPGAHVWKDSSPWMYDVPTAHWIKKRVSGAAPLPSYEDVMVYIPTKKQALYFSHNSGATSWLYDPAANAWTLLSPQGPTPNPYGLSCYDPKRDRIYMGTGASAFWIFDVATTTWIAPQPAGTLSTSFISHNATMSYDVANDVVVVLVNRADQGNGAAEGVYVYDPSSNAWTVASTTFPAVWNNNMNGFYDPVTNLHFIHDARDNSPGDIWVYRYKRPAGPPPADGDGDGLPDTWETQHFGNLNQNGTGDPDGDGQTNLAEYQAGSDPRQSPQPSTGGGDDGCGATGMEILFLPILLRLTRPRRRTAALLSGERAP